MTLAGIYGLPGPVRVKRLRGVVTADDLVNRKFHPLAPNELWVTGITQHRTREGWLYCCAVLDAFSRRIVGWSMDSKADATLVVNGSCGVDWNTIQQHFAIIVEPGVQGGSQMGFTLVDLNQHPSVAYQQGPAGASTLWQSPDGKLIAIVARNNPMSGSFGLSLHTRDELSPMTVDCSPNPGMRIETGDNLSYLDANNVRTTSHIF